MTDLLSVMFLIGISVVFMIFSFIWKNTLLTIMSGLGWIIVSIYLFSMYYSGDSDYGYSVFGFSWLTLATGMGMLLMSWWSHRKKTEQMSDKVGETFYTEGDPEFKEINDMYKARANKKKLRGR
jgi:ABC-type multidrug transport system fused ATPase/permease subunit